MESLDLYFAYRQKVRTLSIVGRSESAKPLALEKEGLLSLGEGRGWDGPDQQAKISFAPTQRSGTSSARMHLALALVCVGLQQGSRSAKPVALAPRWHWTTGMRYQVRQVNR